MADEDKKDTTTTGDGAGTNAGKDEQKKGGDPNQGKTFTQEEVNAIVKERLEREQKKAEADKKKAEDAAKEAALKEQGEFKKLAEQQTAKIAEMERHVLEAQAKAEELRIRQEVERQARALGFKAGREEAVYRLIDLAGVTVGDDGAVKGVKEALEKIKKDVPELLEPAKGGTNINAAGGGKGNSEAEQKEREAEIKRRFRL